MFIYIYMSRKKDILSCHFFCYLFFPSRLIVCAKLLERTYIILLRKNFFFSFVLCLFSSSFCRLLKGNCTCSFVSEARSHASVGHCSGMTFFCFITCLYSATDEEKNIKSALTLKF